MGITLPVFVLESKEQFIPQLGKLALKHGIKFVKAKPVEGGSQFHFKLQNGEENKRDAFINAVPIDWLNK